MSTQLEGNRINQAAVWRSDYERCREIYGVTSSYVLRFRRQLIQATKDTLLSKVERNEMLTVVAQMDDELRGR